MSDLPRVIDTARMLQADAETDATALDRTPFTGRGMGETFGATLAMIGACARLIELLAEHIQTQEQR